MGRKPKEPGRDNSRYTTIILLKTSITKLSEARNKYKEETKNFSQLGLGSFIEFLLDFYETNRVKNEKSV